MEGILRAARGFEKENFGNSSNRNRGAPAKALPCRQAGGCHGKHRIFGRLSVGPLRPDVRLIKNMPMG